MTTARVEPAPHRTGPAPGRERVYYFDYLRMWATIGVISVHAGAGITDASPHQDGFLTAFNAGNAYNSLGRFGVGCFFMISGALLLDPLHRFRLGKQLLRVLIPLMFWSAVVVLVNDVLAHRHDVTIGGSSLQDPEDVKHAFVAFFAGPLAYHFWFVYVLVGIYLVVPLLRPLTALPQRQRGRLLRYGLLLWFLFSVVYWTARHADPSVPSYWSGAIPQLPSYYLGLVLLGFYLHHHGIRVRGRELPAGAYLALAVTAVVTTFLLVWLGDTPQTSTPWPYHNLTPQIVGYAAGLFLFAKAVMNRPGRCYPFVALFSRLSYRIYLMHVLLLHYFRQFSPLHDWYYDQPAIALAVAVAFTVVGSFLLAWLLDQIRPIRNYV